MRKKQPTPLNVCAHGRREGNKHSYGLYPARRTHAASYNVMAISSQPKLKGHTDERSRNASRIEPIFIFQQNTELLPKSAESTRTLGKNCVLTQRPMEQQQRCRGKPGRQEGRQRGEASGRPQKLNSFVCIGKQLCCSAVGMCSIRNASWQLDKSNNNVV